MAEGRASWEGWVPSWAGPAAAENLDDDEDAPLESQSQDECGHELVSMLC